MAKKLSLGGVLAFMLILLYVHPSVEESVEEGDTDIQPSDNLHPPDAMMNTEEMAKCDGYPAETHNVETEDGYILTVHRIPHGKGEDDGGHRPVVFLQHGLLFCSAAWVIKGPQEGLAYILADAGYDVWIGNFRGNMYSTGHVNDSVQQSSYWNFSWHEMAKYDLPAMIDYALKETNTEKLFYIGHSTGANVFYIMCTIRPEYNAKIEAQFSLAPDAVFDNSHSAPRSVGRHIQHLTGALVFFHRPQSFTGSMDEQQMFSSSICMDDYCSSVCQIIFYLLGDISRNDFDKETLDLMMAHYPTATSRKTILYYSHSAYIGKYAELNSSLSKNKKIKFEILGEYDLKLVDVPVHLYYSKDDIISTEMEARILQELFPKSKSLFEVPSDEFAHLDFLWGKNVKTLLFDQLLEDLKEHQGGP